MTKDSSKFGDGQGASVTKIPKPNDLGKASDDVFSLVELALSGQTGLDTSSAGKKAQGADKDASPPPATPKDQIGSKDDDIFDMVESTIGKETDLDTVPEEEKKKYKLDTVDVKVPDGFGESGSEPPDPAEEEEPPPTPEELEAAAEASEDYKNKHLNKDGTPKTDEQKKAEADEKEAEDEKDKDDNTQESKEDQPAEEDDTPPPSDDTQPHPTGDESNTQAPPLSEKPWGKGDIDPDPHKDPLDDAVPVGKKPWGKGDIDPDPHKDPLDDAVPVGKKPWGKGDIDPDPLKDPNTPLPKPPQPMPDPVAGVGGASSEFADLINFSPPSDVPAVEGPQGEHGSGKAGGGPKIPGLKSMPGTGPSVNPKINPGKV